MQLADSTDNPLVPDGVAVVGLALAVAIWAVTVLAYVRILQKAGYSGWWVLVGLVPVANVVFFLVFAFARWPVVEENARLRAGLGSAAPRR